jgi:16S rRNA U1498 N3-methylase RsmE
VKFDAALDVSGLGVMFSERGGDAFESLTRQVVPNALTAFVGSEGGWSDEEIESARARNFHVITLGGRIMRAETAAIAVTALLQHRIWRSEMRGIFTQRRKAGRKDAKPS